jgi:hypothetical protein
MQDKNHNKNIVNRSFENNETSKDGKVFENDSKNSKLPSQRIKERQWRTPTIIPLRTTGLAVSYLKMQRLDYKETNFTYSFEWVRKLISNIKGEKIY